MTDTMLEGLKDRISKSAKIHQSVGIIVPMNNYADLSEAIIDHMMNTKDDFWVYITITKSFDTIIKKFKSLSDHKNIKFIDCISRAAGIVRSDNNCIYVESPAMLEKILMEMINILHEIKDDLNKYIIIDSLSSLMIYNNPETVNEFFQHFINKTRAEDVHSISLVVEEEMDEYINRIIFLNEKIIKVRESFI
ncbi:MAG: hypothetical protein DRO67_05450 [Candidatus Asgardarchaeum californiense]|nr:MAG: hypothetical protein DRO67_05450 [Candidatus Asgardarchaeum californiense]